VKGVVVGEGDTYEEALADVRSALKFHVESFGAGVLDAQPFRQTPKPSQRGEKFGLTLKTRCTGGHRCKPSRKS
jgi:uncharacterized glyoxalase superfamily protein PhnB